MSKEIENTDAEGNVTKETVYTVDEYKAIEEKAGQVDKLQTDLAEAQRVNAERAGNFTAYSKMTEEEKKVYDANTTNLLKREEALQTELATMKETITQKELKERELGKTTAMKNIHQGDEATKKKVEDAYGALAGMPETTQEEINARVVAASRVAGIVIDQRNPLYIPVEGEAPKYDPAKEYVETPEGSTAADMVRNAMGLPKAK